MSEAIPTVYLSIAPQGENIQRFMRTGIIQPQEAPSVYLAHVPGAQGDNCLLGRKGSGPLPDESLPALLFSFFYVQPFLDQQADYRYREWALDSGAFSAFNSGKEIDLDAYVVCARRLLDADPTLREIFALDVIGDPIATMKNTEAMLAAGIPAIPTYHFRTQDYGILRELCARFPKVAIGGVAKLRGNLKRRFLEEVFARAWPKRLHGFGCGGRLALDFPFHSVDATNWEMGPCGFGSWRSMPGIKPRGGDVNLRAEVEWYLNLEREARARWGRILREIPA